MSLKYLLIICLFTVITPELHGQFGQPARPADFRFNISLNHSYSNVQKITFSRQNLFASLTPQHNLNWNLYGSNNSEAYFLNNMPTLNQLKNSMLDNIDLPADYGSELTFIIKDSDETEKDEEEGSFFSSSLFYFLGAAALATTFYILWQDNTNETTTRTFGYPPRPETDP